LMRRIAWLRAMAIFAGCVKIIYRTVFVFDPVAVMWEIIFITVNVYELSVIWWRNRPLKLTAEEQQLVTAIAPELSPAATRALMAQAIWRDEPAKTRLTTQGQPVQALSYILSGDIGIFDREVQVGRLGPGDFLGEMTWLDGSGATASAIALSPVRLARFDRATMQQVFMRNEVLRFVLQASISRNLTRKVLRQAAPQ
jgi:CRP-like cAMP-binding protein